MHCCYVLQPRAHGMVCEVLSTLVHGSYGFVPIDFNPKEASCRKDGSFLYKLESSLTHN